MSQFFFLSLSLCCLFSFRSGHLKAAIESQGLKIKGCLFDRSTYSKYAQQSRPPQAIPTCLPSYQRPIFPRTFFGKKNFLLHLLLSFTHLLTRWLSIGQTNGSLCQSFAFVRDSFPWGGGGSRCAPRPSITTTKRTYVRSRWMEV